MKNQTPNFHTYTTKTVNSVELPPGRYLKVGEEIENCDLYLPEDANSICIPDLYPVGVVSFGTVKNFEEGKFYRPTGTNYVLSLGDDGMNIEPADSSCKFHNSPTYNERYRLLKEGEGVKTGDEFFDYENGEWCKLGNLDFPVDTSEVGYIRRRRHIRTRF